MQWNIVPSLSPRRGTVKTVEGSCIAYSYSSQLKISNNLQNIINKLVGNINQNQEKSKKAGSLGAFIFALKLFLFK